MVKEMIGRVNKYALLILIGWVIILTVIYSTLAIVRHNNYQSGAFDLGIYDQAIWQYSRFIYPFNTVKGEMILGDHLTLTLPLLAPLYYIWDDVRILLIFQAVLITVSAISVFLFLRNRKFLPVEALLLGIMYSLFFSVQYSVYFDFHPIVIGAAILPWIIYFLESKKTKLLWLSVILTLLTQENMGIAVAGIGLCYVFSKAYRKYAISFIIVGLLWGVVATKIVAGFSPSGYEYAPHIAPNIFAIIRGFFDTNERRTVWLYTLSWFSFLPLFSPGACLLLF